MKKIVVLYTTIGTVLVILGVYTTPTKVSASNINNRTEQVSMVHIDAVEKLLETISIETKEEKDYMRTSTILQAMEDGKITERQAEILDDLESITPMDKDVNVYEQLSNVYSVTKEEFLSLREVMEELNIDINTYF